MTRRLLLALSFAASAVWAVPGSAQQAPAPASGAEVAGIEATIALIGCRVGDIPVEKESEELFEIDDAVCGAGQFDIKLDGDFAILSITADGEADPAAPASANADDDRINAALELFNCEIGPVPVEREAGGFYEIDDAICEAGQYDIKLDEFLNIINLTFDGRSLGLGGPGPDAPPAAQPPPPQQPQPQPQPQPPAPPLPPAAGPQAFVTVDLNLRQAPAPTASVILVIPRNAIVAISFCTIDYEWCQATYNGYVGWVAAQYLVSVTLQQPIPVVGPQLGIIIVIIDDGMPEPGQDFVCFYEGANYSGSAFCAIYGEFNPALSPEWNDRISSIRVGSNAEIEVCEDTNFAGTCQIIGSDIPQLPGNLNNAISSYRTPGFSTPPPSGADPGEVCFFADAGYGGDSFCIDASSSNPSLGGSWNDRITSIRVGSNAAVEVCTDTNFGGACVTFADDVAQLQGSLNDNISSHRPPQSGGQPPAAPGANEVCFYADVDFGGDSSCFAASQSTPALTANWNDRVSSIRLGAGALIEVCTDANFAGTCQVIGADVAALSGGLNDSISSHRPPAPGEVDEPAPPAPPPADPVVPAPGDPPPPVDPVEPPAPGDPVEPPAPADPPPVDPVEPPPPADPAPVDPVEPPPPADPAPVDPVEPPPPAVPPADPVEPPPPVIDPPVVDEEPVEETDAPAEEEVIEEEQATGQACFFADASFGGASFCVPLGSEGAMPGGFDDVVSSISIEGSGTLTVCTEPGLGGDCATLSSSSSGLGLDDSISSYRFV